MTDIPHRSDGLTALVRRRPAGPHPPPRPTPHHLDERVSCRPPVRRCTKAQATGPPRILQCTRADASLGAATAAQQESVCMQRCSLYS